MLLRWLLINYLLTGQEGARRFLKVVAWMALVLAAFVVLVALRW